MREIKFRAWDSLTGKMFTPDAILNDGTGRAVLKSGLIGKSSLYDSERFPTMQYTGLKDSNGVEIYEGDIVGDGKGLGVVRYKSPSFIVCNPEGEFNLGAGLAYPDGSSLKDTEIIGNIHENPGLLR